MLNDLFSVESEKVRISDPEGTDFRPSQNQTIAPVPQNVPQDNAY